MGALFAAGLQGLIDGQQSYIRSGLVTYLRIENFAPQGDWQEVGVPYSPTGAAAASTGFVDLEIIPPPEVRDVSMHNIGMSGGRLNIGARTFIVSDTFVQSILQQYPKISDPADVWRNWDAVYVDGNPEQQTASVVGIVYDNRMHDIVYFNHREIAGQTISWLITCNRQETPLYGTSQQDNSEG